MKLFIDTANLKEISDALETGTISGITTNPSLLSKEPKQDFMIHMKKIVDLCRSYGEIPLSVEVFASSPDAMYDQAIELSNELNYSNLNIKIPIGYEELKVISRLAKEGVKVNCTCCFTATQLESAALAGARYVSLFYNRLIDGGGNPLEVLKQTKSFINDSNLDCEIISGSIRSAKDVSNAWTAGSDIVTAGFPVIKKMVSHTLTDVSVEGFLRDFQQWIQK